jgi:flagellin
MAGSFFNVSNMMSQNRLRLFNRSLSSSLERLATGSRINQSKDDPFRNSESLKLECEIKSGTRARQNSTDGAALLQIAEGTCNEVQNLLQRIRELAVQSANDTLTSTERQYLHIESTGLLNEIDRIVASTTYNTKQIFGNEGDSFSDEARLLRNKEKPLEEWSPYIVPRKDGEETYRRGVLHIGPSTSIPEEVRISLPEISAKHLGLETLSITYQAGATRAIDEVDAALSSITTIRSYMGTLVNRLDTQVDYLDEKNISLTDYTAKIRDSDIAKETTSMVSSQIQQQAAISIMSQSNARLNNILNMLAR